MISIYCHENEPNQKHKLMFQMEHIFKLNKTKLYGDFQIHSIRQVIVKITEKQGYKNKELSFTALNSCVYCVDGTTYKQLYDILGNRRQIYR